MKLLLKLKLAAAKVLFGASALFQEGKKIVKDKAPIAIATAGVVYVGVKAYKGFCGVDLEEKESGKSGVLKVSEVVAESVDIKEEIELPKSLLPKEKAIYTQESEEAFISSLVRLRDKMKEEGEESVKILEDKGYDFFLHEIKVLGLELDDIDYVDAIKSCLKLNMSGELYLLRRYLVEYYLGQTVTDEDAEEVKGYLKERVKGREMSKSLLESCTMYTIKYEIDVNKLVDLIREVKEEEEVRSYLEKQRRAFYHKIEEYE